MAFRKIGEVVLHVAHRPAAAQMPTIAFANSLGTDLRIWDKVVDGLPGEWGVLSYDKRGHGLSDLGEAADRLDAHVADLKGLLDVHGVDRAVVCGLSVGGIIAQGLTADAPERVAGLVLSNTAAKIGERDVWDARIAEVEAGGIAALADAVLKRWFGPEFHAASPAVLSGMRNMLVRQDAHGYGAICRLLRDADLREAATRIAVPTMLLGGTADGSTPPEVIAETAALIADAEVHVIDGVGHIPCVETPAVVASLLVDFVTRRVLD